ncbi:MAG: hypothetical protein MUO53_08390 [Maribacter sp.]|nr:hypothetical protein [Maribacter sp.]
MNRYKKGQKCEALDGRFWKIPILNLALLLMGIGVGIGIGRILRQNLADDSFYAIPGTIFLLSGTGLLISFFITKSLDKEA